jgi:hypothetical protein
MNGQTATATLPVTVANGGGGGQFVDVPLASSAYASIEALVASGITGGCATTPPQYCPDAPVTRAQMAVFLVRALAYPAVSDARTATGTIFADVPATHPLAPWIEELAAVGVTSGCGTVPPLYCPGSAVTRAEMAAFLLRAKHGPGWVPPQPAQQLFADVPLTHPMVRWITALAAEGLTTGCATGPTRYCPDQVVTRGQMAVFIVRALGLPM